MARTRQPSFSKKVASSTNQMLGNRLFDDEEEVETGSSAN
jgi:hypothetical protein